VVTAQVPVDLPWVADLAVLFAFADAPALGFEDALAFGVAETLGLGVVLAAANPANSMELAAVAAIRVGHLTMLGRRFRINARTPRQIRRRHRRAAPGHEARSAHR
jgi:hypothetical protein